MKLTHYIYISTALAALAACSDDVTPDHFVGEADNAIRLEAGVVDGGSTVKTRANWDTANDGARHNGKHLPLESGIKLNLQVSGTWTGHDPESVIKETVATVGTEIADSKHNNLTFSPQLYWDDYGTADPDNKETGRNTGLTIYGVAVNDKTVTTPAPTSNTTTGIWETLSWDLSSFNKTVNEVSINDQTGGWSTKDLIISNNVQTGKDGTLKFDAWKASSGNDLLEFKHAMSKITINLKAYKGFPTTAAAGQTLVGKTTNKFESTPTVHLLTRNSSKAEVAYAITSGTVDVQTGVVTGSSNDEDKKIIKTKLDNIHEAWPSDATEFQYTVQMTALVFPGSVIGAAWNDANAENGTPSSASQMTIAKLEVDGNVYYINAQKISEAINGANDYKTEAGKNYILNITVDKTEVNVYATVANWVDVIAQEATPKIEITTSYGDEGTAFPKDNLSFYYSKAKDAPDIDIYGIATGTDPSVYYQGDAAGTNNAGKITLDPNIYWPNHSTKYFFRGVWPKTNVDSRSPFVAKFAATDGDHQGVKVSNEKYVSGTFPSDLLIGIPHVENPTAEGPLDEPADGISATEGKITLNFTYRMAQVEVHLVSSGAGAANNIDFGSKVTDKLVIPQAKVEIVNGYTEGYILLADGSSKFASTAAVANYEMTPKSTDDQTSIPTNTEGYKNNYFYRHDVVIPQSLGTTDANAVKFCVTTYTPKEGSTSEYTEDRYYINVKDIILTSINGVACTEENNKITEWEAGKHYVYTLKITKTQVIIEATIIDWIPVVAGGDFWL